jgi:ABC-type dipeptide/oligopeptide/nickel transport system ATPase component
MKRQVRLDGVRRDGAMTGMAPRPAALNPVINLGEQISDAIMAHEKRRAARM